MTFPEKSMKNTVNILCFYVKTIRHSLAWKLQYYDINYPTPVLIIYDFC